MLHAVYILFSVRARKIYVGVSSNLIQRFYSHNTYGKGWTSKYRPWVVIYTEPFDDKSAALIKERRLKSGQGRKWIWDKINTQFFLQGFISD
jgi:putative endonuclease